MDDVTRNKVCQAAKRNRGGEAGEDATSHQPDVKFRNPCIRAGGNHSIENKKAEKKQKHYLQK